MVNIITYNVNRFSEGGGGGPVFTASVHPIPRNFLFIFFISQAVYASFVRLLRNFSEQSDP